MSRAGRKRKDKPRVNGRIKQTPRFEKAEDMQAIVREARERVFNLSKQQAISMPETNELGRLRATGEISQRQWEAGVAYRDVVREHDRHIGAAGLPRAADLDRTGGGHTSNEETQEQRSRYRLAMTRYDRCRAALRDAGRTDRMAAAVVDAICVNDWALPDMVPSLRVGLNHLAQSEGISLPPLDTRRELVQP